MGGPRDHVSHQRAIESTPILAYFLINQLDSRRRDCQPKPPLLGPTSLGATIVAGNTGGNCYITSGGLLNTSVGYNLTDDPSTANTCNLTSSTDVLGASPQLGALANNGGPTQTLLPVITSPAVGVILSGPR